MYDKLISGMDALKKRQLMFGASVTVTTENLDEVTSDAFVSSLAARGCKLILYIEFVPVTQESQHLAPGDAEREQMEAALSRLREAQQEVVFIAFPGDEKSSEGCLAAGRGFFHINSHGGAEPCPFSPYSDVNVRDTTLRGALQSPLFTALRSGGILEDMHIGGCVLHEKQAEVEALLCQGK